MLGKRAATRLQLDELLVYCYYVVTLAIAV